MVQVTKIAGLEPLVKLRELVLRSSLISKMEGLSTLTNLVHLELYDNQVEALEVSAAAVIQICAEGAPWGGGRRGPVSQA